ncbi:hypothetical protein TNCV_5136791 [Trichonephila clavipes]|nr:hypothetical protein TNCV_5136791 [Trichonephila clavipes]
MAQNTGIWYPGIPVVQSVLVTFKQFSQNLKIHLSVGDMMYQFRVYLTEEELILPYWESGIFISVHSPFVFNNFTLHKHEMKPGRSYDINIRLVRSNVILSPSLQSSKELGKQTKK